MRSTAFLTILSFVLSFSIEVSAQAAASAAYAPALGACPSGTSLLRNVGTDASAQTVSSDEQSYISSRKTDVLPSAWKAYLAAVENASPNVALPDYLSKVLGGDANAPTLGIATSGGGHRAAIVGAGILNALDGRNQSSVGSGTGGLLQAASYLAGLSGGSWLVGSLAQGDFPTIPHLVFGGDGVTGWQTQLDLLAPTGNTTTDAEYVKGLFAEIAYKYIKGFPVTIADIWARALSHHFVNGTTAENVFDESLTHGAGATWSSVAKLPSFQSHQQPFPIILANTITSKNNGSEFIEPVQGVVALENPIYEFNVFEMGSWDPVLGAFTPTKYLGSPNDTACVTGYDQVSFVQGISADLFIEYNQTGVDILQTAIGSIIGGLEATFPEPNLRLDTAAVPNPFFGVAPDVYPDTAETILNLVDGGMDGEVTPYQPLLVKARGVDTILAIDAVADSTDNWAQGRSLIATADRVNMFYGASYSFPSVPTDVATFVAQNLTTRPTFFGCDVDAASDAPLVIYIANGGAPLGEAPVTNTSTAQTQYALDQVQAMLDQSFALATQGIPTDAATRDPEWPACLACAVADRSRRALGVERSGVCTSCMERYCWSA
ncbi:lysophospholipase [Epithele typhae]|uniref:lysophospholipase n=1 Tax=Epithele typhae TaxID=378194 RepID=UPI002007A6C7|nr:lysophospholipase [Epithele typhae]KAH9928016.1 lysophospholipase [Epithele typhae]